MAACGEGARECVLQARGRQQHCTPVAARAAQPRRALRASARTARRAPHLLTSSALRPAAAGSAGARRRTTLDRLAYTLAISNLKACMVTPPDTCGAARRSRRERAAQGHAQADVQCLDRSSSIPRGQACMQPSRPTHPTPPPASQPARRPARQRTDSRAASTARSGRVAAARSATCCAARSRYWAAASSPGVPTWVGAGQRQAGQAGQGAAGVCWRPPPVPANVLRWQASHVAASSLGRPAQRSTAQHSTAQHALLPPPPAPHLAVPDLRGEHIEMLPRAPLGEQQRVGVCRQRRRHRREEVVGHRILRQVGR